MLETLKVMLGGALSNLRQLKMPLDHCRGVRLDNL